MADLGEEAFSSQMKVVTTFLRLLEELMRNKQLDLRYGTKTQRRGILRRMKDFVGGIFKKVYDGTFGRLSRNGKDYGQLDLNDPAVAKLFADTMKQMGMDAMHEDNNLLFSTSDVAKILAFSKMVEQELGKKIEHENDTPEKKQSQEHGQDQERQANARGWSDYPATPEQIDLTATVLAADEGVSIDEIKKDFSENPSIGELQIALEAKGHDTMAIQPDLKNYATPEQRAQLDMLKDKGIIGENELMQLGKYPSQDKASEVLENHADAVKMLDSDEISNRAEAIRSHDGMDPDSHTKQVESWKEDLSAKVGNAFEASRDANGQPNLNNFALQCNLRGIAVQFANDGELLYALAESMPGTTTSLPYQVFREVVNEHDTNYLIALAIAIDALPKDSTYDKASETIRANADIDIAERRKSVLPDQTGLAAKKASCIESLAHIGGNAPVCGQDEIAR